MRKESKEMKSSQPDLPRVAALHDSVYPKKNGVQGKRLGQPKFKFKTSTIEEIDKTVEVFDFVAGPVDTIAKAVSKSLVKSLRLRE